MLDDTILMLELESPYNRHPNSLESDFELLTIQFWDPNLLSLVCFGGIIDSNLCTHPRG